MFNYKMSVYVPSTENVDEKNDVLSAHVTNNIAFALSKRYGGATIIDASGTYVTQTTKVGGHKLIEETTHIVYALTETCTDDDVSFIRRLAKYIKRKMTQECVLWSIEQCKGGLE